MACSHSSPPTVRSSASNSSSFTFTPPPWVDQWARRRSIPNVGGPRNVDRRPQAVDGLHEFVRLAAGDSFALANRLPGDREVVVGGAGAGDAMGLGVGVD